MATLKETAQAFVPQQTSNIADLQQVSVDLEIKTEKGITQKDGKEFTYKYIEVDGKKYRMPGVVLGQLKMLLGKMPNLKHFSVAKEGTGMNTKYQVIPLLK